MGDDLREALERRGVRVERREVGVVPQMVASGLGGIAGSALAHAAGAGWFGRALASLGGSIVGHLAATHRVRMARPREAAGAVGGGEPITS